MSTRGPAQIYHRKIFLTQVQCSFDVELPTECDDEYWEHSNPNLTFKQPEGKPSVMTYWICMLKLLDIFAFAQRTIVSMFHIHLSPFF